MGVIYRGDNRVYSNGANNGELEYDGDAIDEAMMRARASLVMVSGSDSDDNDS